MLAHPVSTTQRVMPLLGIRLSRRRELHQHNECGTALVFALVILLLLTILGITAVTTSSLQEKMAGNMRDQYMALQASDSILRDGQSLVFNQTTKPTPSCPPDIVTRIWDSDCLPATVSAASGPNWWSTATETWWLNPAFAFTSSVATGLTFQEPRFAVERIQQAPVTAEIGKNKKVYRFYYRTTGWSVGATNYSQGITQDVFSKRSDTYQN